MKYSIYILYSHTINKFYVGYSSNIENRIAYHNSIEYNRIWSKSGIPWELKFKHHFQTKKEALIAERFIKKQKNRKFIEKLIIEGWKS